MTTSDALAQAQSEGTFPAAAFAFGDRKSVLTGSVGCELDTVFDLASLTKVVSTTPVILSLVNEGKLDLDAPVGQYLPAWSSRDVPVHRLLSHTSGLPPYDFPLAAQGLSREATMARVLASPVEGHEVSYSCLGFITLTALAESVTGQRMDDLFRERVATPVGMASAGYGPRAEALPTSAVGTPPKGTVHDPLARALGGISGNAGLFAQVDDLVTYARAWLPGGALWEIGADWTTPQPSAGTRALGWDTKSAEGSSAGDRFGPRSFGHLGYTGTSLWIDPEQGLFAILLTNAVVYSEDKLLLRGFRPKFNSLGLDEFLVGRHE